MEETRRQFGVELSLAQVRYQEERDRQYDFYKMTCMREQGVRDRELARADPADRAATALAHDSYDKAIGRAGHIYEGYESRAWKKYMAEAEALRKKYGITEVPE